MSHPTFPISHLLFLCFTHSSSLAARVSSAHARTSWPTSARGGQNGRRDFLAGGYRRHTRDRSRLASARSASALRSASSSSCDSKARTSLADLSRELPNQDATGLAMVVLSWSCQSSRPSETVSSSHSRPSLGYSLRFSTCSRTLQESLQLTLSDSSHLKTRSSGPTAKFPLPPPRLPPPLRCRSTRSITLALAPVLAFSSESYWHACALTAGRVRLTPRSGIALAFTSNQRSLNHWNG